nr:caskin-1-like [Aegilops tauschii subsp. strangulata]
MASESPPASQSPTAKGDEVLSQRTFPGQGEVQEAVRVVPEDDPSAAGHPGERTPMETSDGGRASLLAATSHAAEVSGLKQRTATEVETLKKVLAEAEERAGKEQAARKKHEARVGEVQQEIQDALKKYESFERQHPMCTVGLLPQQHALHRANPPPPPPPPPAAASTDAGGRPEDGLAGDPRRATSEHLPPPPHLRRPHPRLRRLITDRSFLRRFRKIHPPPLLGFLDPVVHRFHPAVRPHRSAPAAGAVALAADFSFAFLPAPGSSSAFLPAPARDWTVREVRDGRVLLDRPRRHDSGDGLEALFKEMLVCDPLHRQYLLLPPIPDDMAASVADHLMIYGQSFAETFLVPPGYDEEEAATATAETSFRVIWVVLL